MKELVAFIGALIFVLQIVAWFVLAGIPIVRYMPIILFAPLSGLSFVMIISGSAPPASNK